MDPPPALTKLGILPYLKWQVSFNVYCVKGKRVKSRGFSLGYTLESPGELKKKKSPHTLGRVEAVPTPSSEL